MFSGRWRAFLQWVMDRRPTKLYEVQGVPLFYRAFLFRAWPWVVYMHRYLRSDPDERGLHDHPMRARILILAGGYDEERVVGFSRYGLVKRTRRLRPGKLGAINEYTFHRVTIPEGHESWSLFAARSVPDKRWGFMKENPRRVPRATQVDGECAFTYVEEGDGLPSAESVDAPWWTRARNGKEVRLEAAHRPMRPAGGTAGRLGDDDVGPQDAA